MSINFILLFLICHVIGDYYLQSQDMAENKNCSFNWVMIHSAVYCLPFIIILIFFKKTKFLFCLLVLLCLSHLILDIIKYFAYTYYKNIKNGSMKCKMIVLWVKQWMVYVLDQLTHIILIVVLCYSFKENSFSLIPSVKNILVILNLNSITILKWTLIMLCIYKPANITFKILFSWCKPKNNICEDKNSKDNDENINKHENTEALKNTIEVIKEAEDDKPIENVGAIIGFLERVIIVLFLVANQYSAIGFVLTAKSIARYNLISKSQSFAEYYLVGTLYSVLFSVVLYNIIF